MCTWEAAFYAAATAGSVNAAEQQRQSASEDRTMQREAIAKADQQRAQAEASAVQTANAKLAADKERRQRGTLLAKGAPSIDSVLSSTPASVDQKPGVPLLARGAGAQFYGA